MKTFKTLLFVMLAVFSLNNVAKAQYTPETGQGKMYFVTIWDPGSGYKIRTINARGEIKTVWFQMIQEEIIKIDVPKGERDYVEYTSISQLNGGYIYPSFTIHLHNLSELQTPK